MGMYTELHFNAQMKRDIPKPVLDTLAYMTDQANVIETLPDHPLFQEDTCWRLMLVCDSAYFPMAPASSIDYEEDGRWYLRVRSNFKNYDDEIRLFLDWVMPWVEAGDECLGYWRYEENDDPTLIYKRNFPQAAAVTGEEPAP